MGPWYCSRCLHAFGADAATCPNLACAGSRPEGGWGRLLAEGELLDRHYAISRRLAVGGAGITYLARATDEAGAPVGDDLAIKVLYATRDSGAYLQRLANEAQILQGLDHPHLVRCVGFVQRAGRAPYLITRFERGGTLDRHLVRVGPLAPAVAVRIVAQVLGALGAAHDRGVVHRDLKPQNVLLRAEVSAGETPHCLVADFGVAKVAGTLQGGLTQVGAFVGTPEFAAPEQLEGRPTTPASDVFAAGALLVYLLTGRPPFTYPDRTDAAECLARLRAQWPPALPEGLGSDRPGLERVLAGAMALSPSHRFTAPQMVLALRGERVARPAPAAPAPTARLSASPNDLTLDDLLGAVPRPQPEPPPSAAEVPSRGAQTPLPAPSPPPASIEDLLATLGTVEPVGRAAVLDALAGRRDLDPTLSRLRRAGDAPTRRGVALAMGATGDPGWATAARELLADADVGVRACAVEALGSVATASMLPALRGLLTDAAEPVRAAATLALVRAGARHGRPDLARGWVDAARADASQVVRRAWLDAMAELDGDRR